MPLPQLPPGGGGKPRRIHFGYVSPAHGKSYHAWLAGPAMWFECHTKGKSKPCLHWMTGGELSCKRCDALESTEEQGYVPLYRESDSKPVFVVVKSYTREKVDALKTHQRVMYGRDQDRGSGVFVGTAVLPTPTFQTTMPEKKKPADLTETLLRVWCIPELIEWFRQTGGAPAIEAPKGPVPKRGDGSEFSPMMRAAAARAYAAPPEPGDGPLVDLMDEIKNRTKGFKSETNGHHKPKG